MAESNETKPDDFDAMMQDSSDTDKTESDDLLDDEDAIDRLLMDDSTDDIAQSTDQDAAARQETAFDEVDEFAEIDEFSDDPEELQVEALRESEQDPNDIFSDLDTNESFLNSDFDISTEEDEPDLFAEQETETTKNESSEDPVNESDHDDLFEAVIDADNTESDTVDARVEPMLTTADTAEHIVDEALHAQVNQLWAEMEGFKQTLSTATEEISQVAKKQKKNNQVQVNNSTKNKQFIYAVMAVAAIALIVTGVVGFNSYSTNTELAELTEMVTDMDETIADSSIDKKPNQQVQLLKKSIEIIEAKQLVIERQLSDLINSVATQDSQTALNNTSESNQLLELSNQVEALNKQLSTLQSKVVKLDRKKDKSAPSNKQTVKSTEWTVNLVSFKLEWYAKKKAAEFKKQGIPVEVVQAQVKNELWYRIRVSGFKTKYEAGAYATRVKKALNLSSVWVTKK